MRIKVLEIIVLAVVILGVLAFITLPIMGGTIFLPSAEDSNVRTIMIKARAKELGGFEPSEVVVKQGERVRLLIYTEDVVHGFGLSEYNIKLELHPGRWEMVEFTASNAGEFRFVCTIFCSPLHALMRGKIIVQAS